MTGRAELQAQALAEQARQAEARGDLDAAGELLRRAAAADPGNADVHCDSARLLLQCGECARAIEHLEYASRQASDDADTWTSLARAYHQGGRIAEARQALDHVLALAPDDTAALLLAARFADEAGDPPKALRLCYRVLEVDANDVDARLMIARLHLNAHEVEQALPLLRSVARDAQVAPARRAEAGRGVARAHAERGRWSEAVEACEAVVRLDPDPSAVDWHRLAEARLRVNDRAGAARDVRTALAIDPAHAEASRLAATLAERPYDEPRAVLYAGHSSDW